MRIHLFYLCMLKYITHSFVLTLSQSYVHSCIFCSFFFFSAFALPRFRKASLTLSTDRLSISLVYFNYSISRLKTLCFVICQLCRLHRQARATLPHGGVVNTTLHGFVCQISCAFVAAVRRTYSHFALCTTTVRFLVTKSKGGVRALFSKRRAQLFFSFIASTFQFFRTATKISRPLDAKYAST